jgi:hypothetical protein
MAPAHGVSRCSAAAPVVAGRPGRVGRSRAGRALRSGIAAFTGLALVFGASAVAVRAGPAAAAPGSPPLTP